MNLSASLILKIAVLSLLPLFAHFAQPQINSDADKFETFDSYAEAERIRTILKIHLSAPSENNQKLLEAYDRALKLSGNDDTKDFVSSILVKKGDIYFQTAMYGDALAIYNEALSQYLKRGDTLSAALVKLKIRQTYYFADLPLPENYAPEAARTLSLSPNAEHQAIANYLKWISETDPRKREDYLKAAVELQKNLIKLQPSQSSYSYYARFLNASGDFGSAIEAAERSGDNWLLVLILNNYGAELVAERKYIPALNIFNRSLQLCKTNHLKTLLRNTTENIATVYRKTGDYRRASHYQHLMFLIGESLYLDKFSDQISAQKVKYELEKKELENKFLRNEKESLAKVSDARVNLIYLLIISVVAVTFVLYLVFMSRRKLESANALLDKQNSEISEQKKDLEKLNDVLSESEKKLKDAQYTAHLCNWEADPENGEMSYSDSFHDIFPVEKTRTSIPLGKFIDSFVSDNFRAEVKQFFGSAELYQGEIEFSFNRDGKETWIRARKMKFSSSSSRSSKLSGTFQDITNDKAAELRKIKMAEQQSFTRQLIESQEEERKRIAGELHDGLGQELLLIKNRAIFGLQNEKKDEFSGKQFAEIDSSVSSILKSVREISLDLTPAHLGRLGLKTTLKSMINKAEGSSGIEIEGDIDDIDELLPDENKIHVFRIVQETLNNIMKHSGATRAFVGIKKDDGALIMNIRDNGKGYDTAKTIEGSGGFGLKNLYNRIELLNGKIDISSGEAIGTTLLISIPI